MLRFFFFKKIFYSFQSVLSFFESCRICGTVFSKFLKQHFQTEEFPPLSAIPSCLTDGLRPPWKRCEGDWGACFSVLQHDDQSKEHHEGANLDQSCRSARFIVEKCPMRYESIRRHSRCVDQFTEFKTARANVQEVRLEPRLRPTIASATREERSHWDSWCCRSTGWCSAR